ncbi:SusC/RagA family TonB-linked outer membrane protein [Pseudoflavitalea sp. G-6-1-2]|uniref:SusC/RagA family TonB-linked outer membrane protein n=1 Tax=Pseudoflavitalea sp. G-6-1-2 TaxID=2728841 RepID=UPI00146EB7E2|nr:SusC/RagA family TonB-linked outer membrane protein [Pseudoflavitalea sp. G-6-1-2]NML23890.1 SusC/RagA family TonB-linked outer membrane protein [Pseudoflavitalea sp. G-6-1-2]
MRLTALLMISLCLHVSAKTHSQTISFSGRDVSLDKVFTAIEKQTGYFVVWKTNLLKLSKPVTIQADNMPLNQFLKQALQDQPIGFTIENQTIFIRMNRIPAIPAVPAFPLYTAETAFANGMVTDDQGKPLAGVNVQVKGTTRGTITNAEGHYNLPASPGDVLVFSMIGFKTKSVTVVKELMPNVSLSKMPTEFTEVIVSGFQDRRKSITVGSVATATAKDLENAGITTFDKALSGKMPGVYVRSVSGRPGETGSIIIRGINTLTGNVEPLYVLDGMPLQAGEVSGGMNSLITNGIGNIPPENIESITILKDATAASIYGSRAANGVIVITTKNGKIGNDYVNYTGKYGVTLRPEHNFNFMDSKEKVAFERGIRNDFFPSYERGGRVNQLLNLADKGAITYEEAERRIAELENTNTNWINELYRVAQSQSHNISFSGGNTKTTYYAALNFQDAQGSLIQNRFQTGGLNMKLSRFITQDLLFKVNLYSTIKRNVEGQPGMDPFRYAVFANPYEKPYNADGSYASDNTYRAIPYTVGTASSLIYSNFNMIRELKENKLTNTYGNVRGQIALEYSFLRNFKYTGNVAASYTSVQDKDESYAGTYRSWANNWLNTSATNFNILPEYNRGFLGESSGRSFDYTVRNTIEYNNTFAGKHFVQGFFANEFGAVKNDQFRHFNPIYLQKYAIAGYPNWDLVPDTRYMNINLQRLGGTSTRENRSASFIGSAAYAYDNRYVLNANVRYDGVDIIGSDNQFSPLWSAGVKWNAHNEAFLKDYESVLSRLVLSFGYGYRGSINRSVLPFHTYEVGTNVYGGVPVGTNFKYGNPVIKWEQKRETNLGLELSLYKGRVNTELRYFDEEVSDLLDQTKVPPSVGRSSATVNVGNLTNKGYEINVRVEVLKNKDMLWEVGGNFTKINNNLSNVFRKEMPEVPDTTTLNIQDYPVNGWFGYKYSHVDPETGDLIVYAQKVNSKVEGGSVKTTLEDAQINLSKISELDLKGYRPYYLGRYDASWYGGFNTRFTYKAMEFTASFVYAGGNMIQSFRDRSQGPSGFTDDINASRTNRLKENLYRWRQAGDVTNIPAFRNSVSSYTKYLISTDIESGDYLKCNEMSVSWRAPKTVLGKSAVKTLKATLVANNLFVISKYSGTDPESRLPFGYPNTRSFALSLTVGF